MLLLEATGDAAFATDETGRVEAAAALQELGARARDDPAATEELCNHIREAREFCDCVTHEGLERVFGADSAP